MPNPVRPPTRCVVQVMPEEKGRAVVVTLEGMRLSKAAAIVREGVGGTLSSMAFPREHWRSLRTNNPMERINREIRRRTRVVGAFPDGTSALMLASARLRCTAGSTWGTRRYLDMRRLREPAEVTVEATASGAMAAVA